MAHGLPMVSPTQLETVTMAPYTLQSCAAAIVDMDCERSLPMPVEQRNLMLQSLSITVHWPSSGMLRMHTVHMHTCLSCRLAAVCKGLASLQQRSSMHDLLAQDWFIWSQTSLFHFNVKFHFPPICSGDSGRDTYTKSLLLT